MSFLRVEPCDPAPRGLVARVGDAVLLAGSGPSVPALVDRVESTDVRGLFHDVAAHALTDPDVPVAAVGQIDDDTSSGVAIILHGPVRATVETDDGRSEIIDGTASITAYERRFTSTVRSIHATLHTEGADLPDPPAATPARLGEGVVAATSVLVVCHDGPGAAAQPLEAQPLEAQPLEAQPLEAAETETARQGIRCRAGHLNHPEGLYCAVCGAGLAQSGGVRDAGTPLPAGVLVVDDGTVLPVRRPVICGSMPEQADEVHEGTVDGIRLPGALPVQCLVEPCGWDVTVTNLSGANLVLEERGCPDRRDLTPGDQAVLRPGATLVLGERWLRFDTHLRP